MSTSDTPALSCLYCMEKRNSKQEGNLAALDHRVVDTAHGKGV
ncbi:hypothetical protein FHS57_000790 [Runella defluvii]|uniref:Uncharacterized protein n=1 Tax=Runella defluvii TaxID=370973 RepID=A0A7W5ZGC2_9BACT|nr:hypothetical protein [Runella defluvii]MBB3836808.1 hypothetical protein [Runella defluvii]